MEIYYYIAAIAYSIFVIQFVASQFAGDVDLDVDFDGDTDFDVSSIMSFKGLIHFLMGFAGYMSLMDWLHYSISWKTYVWATVIGISLMIVLFFVYKMCLKLQYQPEEPQSLDGYSGQIMYISGNTAYVVITVNGVSREVSAEIRSDVKLLDSVTIHFENNSYYI